MGHERYSTAEIVERGQALYDGEIRATLDSSHDGKYLVLDIETGEYELDGKELDAVKRARKKHPGAVLYIIRVGYPTAHRLGSTAMVTSPC